MAKNFKLSKEKKDQLSLKDITDLGWENVTELFKSNSLDLPLEYFEKGNYWVVTYVHVGTGPIIKVMAKDPSIIEWMPDPERFVITIPCPTKEAFEFITNLLPK